MTESLADERTATDTAPARGRWRRARYERAREIQRMDLDESASTIWWTDMAYEFPWEFSVAGALAFYHSIAPREIAALLARTGELTDNNARRMEHHAIISLEMVRRGFTDPRGREAVRQMNRIHRNAVRHINAGGEQWAITNDMYVFVLATSTLVQSRWVDRHGWRRMTHQERLAGHRHMLAQGRLMGLSGVPEDYDEFARLHDEYVRENFVHTPQAARLWQATQGMLLGPLVSWLPARLQRPGTAVARRVLPALLTPELRRAFGVREPRALTVAAVHAALWLRAAWVRWFAPVRTEPAYPEQMPFPSFPDGRWDLAELGPDHTRLSRP